MMRRSFVVAVIAGASFAAVTMAAQTSAPAPAQALSPSPEFVPDTTFKGSALTGWQPAGDATWKAENGEITGTSSQPGGGGWLMGNQPYQDVAFFSRFICDGPCNAGVLLRATKTATGTTGMFVSLKEGDLNTYKLTLDASGKEVSREVQSNVTYGTIRTGADPAAAAAAPARGGGGGGGGAGGGGGGGGGRPGGGPAPGQPARGRGGPTFTLAGPLPVPMPDLEPPPYGLARQVRGAWDQLQIICDSNIVRPELNFTNEMGPVITNDSSGYGPVYLYVGGTSAVHFKDVSFKDLAVRTIPPERLNARFRKQTLDEFMYAWGAAVADFNKDGQLDITAGPYIYFGPTFNKREELYLSTPMSPSGYPPNMVTHAVDVNGDGYPDILATESRALALYINPGTQKRRWQRYPETGSAVPISGEMSVLKDLNGDGRPEVIGTYQGGAMGYASYDPANPTAPWKVTPVSPPGTGSGHGAGVGDVNGDGRLDILGAAGWSEAPPNFTGEWKYHPVAFGRWGRSQTPGGGEILTYDVNGDGLADVVTSLNGHGWGLAWYEQTKSASGEITFTRHMIMDNYSTKNAGGVTFAELHALDVGDIDGDGIPDIVTGKRYWSHQDSYFDPDSYGEPVLYWYRTVRNKQAPGGAEFVPTLIHNRSGVGSQIVVQDLNKDGGLDIVTATNRGTFVFWGTKPAAPQK